MAARRKNDIVAIRELRPQRLLLSTPPTWGCRADRIIDPDDIAEMFYDDHHNIPLNLIDQLKEDVGGDFVGISRISSGFIIRGSQPIGTR